MSTHFSEKFNNEFNKLDIYKKFPFFIPFVGKNYINAPKKVIFVGESHYLPEKYNNKISREDWYKKEFNDHGIDELGISYLMTKDIVHSVIINPTHPRGHIIYKRIGDVFGEVFNTGGYKESLPYISFYNYFLRPAERKGDSIHNQPLDKTIAFENLIKVNSILKPDKIILVSSKVNNTLHRSYHENKDINIESTLIDSIQHPSTAWWNRESGVNGNQTGKQKVIDILTHLKNQ